MLASHFMQLGSSIAANNRYLQSLTPVHVSGRERHGIRELNASFLAVIP